MSPIDAEMDVREHAPIDTWFGIGGGADLLAYPRTVAQLEACTRDHRVVRVLGDGANLLVDDDGVDGLVVSLREGEFGGWSIDDSTGLVRVGAGANLPKLILECVRRGLGGVEGLAGVPASLGGAVVMNAGGRFGEIGDVVRRIGVLGPEGEQWADASEASFGYRSSALGDRIVTRVELALTPGDPAELRARLKDVMAAKARSQPLAARSCGCVFRNPHIARDIDGVCEAGSRASAGLLLDRAGCKGLTRGGVRISERHANFFETSDGATASDVRALIADATERVADRFGVDLRTEVVIWSRS